MRYQESILIGLHACTPDEVRIIGMALNLQQMISRGRLDKIEPHLIRLLGQELNGKTDRFMRIKDLLNQASMILWENRKPWSVYNRHRESIYGLLSYGLENRLQGKEKEVRRVNRHLQTVLHYPPGGFYGDGNENEEKEGK